MKIEEIMSNYMNGCHVVAEKSYSLSVLMPKTLMMTVYCKDVPFTSSEIGELLQKSNSRKIIINVRTQENFCRIDLETWEYVFNCIASFVVMSQFFQNRPTLCKYSASIVDIFRKAPKSIMHLREHTANDDKKPIFNAYQCLSYEIPLATIE
ncbi:MAG: hypothetical protein JSS82_00205 [Bacteroidetes bacterium]|nr:hypothetical protein [Bacteroidota bacterium]